MGKQQMEIGHLDGRAASGSVLFGFSPGARVDNERLVEWLVRIPEGVETVTITATSEKGGVDRATLGLTL